MINIVRLVALCVLCIPAVAQEQDFLVRSSLGIKANVTEDVSLQIQAQSRLKTNAQEFGGMYYTLSPKIELTKELSLSPEVRFATSALWDKTRYGLGVQYKIDLGKLELSLRTLYQYEYYVQSIPEIGQYPDKQNIRFRIQAEYKLKKRLYAFASIEPQVRIEEQEAWFQRVRNVLGIEWEFTKHHALTASVFIQPQYNSSFSKLNYVAAVGYEFQLPNFYSKNSPTVEE